jgi:hypothetical protein
VPFYPNVPGAKASSVLNAWSGGYWDPVRRELGISGGGHADGSINGVWALSVDTWRWRTVIAASEVPPLLGECADGAMGPNCKAHGGLPDVNHDGSPVARHTYRGIEYLPGVDRFWFASGSNWWNGNASRAAWWGDPATGTWARKANMMVGTLNAFGFLTSSGWDKAAGELVYGNGSGIFAYTPATDTYRLVTGSGSGGGLYVASAVDPVRRYLVHVGRQAGVRGVPGVARLKLGVTNPTWEQMKTTGETAIQSAHFPGFVYAPEIDRFIAWNGGPGVYFLHPTSWTWTKRTMAGPPSTKTPNGMFGRMRAIGNGLAVVIGGTGTEDVGVFRYTPAPVASEFERHCVQPHDL